MEEENIDPEYLKGFNDSYLIAQHEPYLAEQLSKVKGDTPRLSGMRDGHKQYLSDQLKTKLPDWLKTDRATTPPVTSDKTKTRDLNSPEK